MGKMKEIFTELQEQGIDPATVDISEWIKENKRLGEIDDLPEFLVERIRNYDPNKEFNESVQQEFQHAKAVLLQKHKDYGPKNISQSPGGPLNGLRVRMWDKLARINHLIDNGATPENESLRDSFLDLANYSIIAMMVLEGTWPND
jgi:hypothetical protein